MKEVDPPEVLAPLGAAVLSFVMPMMEAIGQVPCFPEMGHRSSGCAGCTGWAGTVGISTLGASTFVLFGRRILKPESALTSSPARSFPAKKDFSQQTMSKWSNKGNEVSIMVSQIKLATNFLTPRSC